MQKEKEILIFKDSEEIADFTLKRWIDIGRKAQDKRGIFTVIVSGGKTPIEQYRRLNGHKGEPAWSRTHIFLADERFVPFDNLDSNYAMIKENLLDNAGIPEENVHPVFMEETAAASAKRYENTLKEFFNLRYGEYPRFDLIMLGIGRDGHTASIFPGSGVLSEKKCLAAAVCINSAKNERITLTLPVINNAENIIFTAAGREKADVVGEILKERSSSLPVSLVKPRDGRTTFLLDKEAAALLK